MSVPEQDPVTLHTGNGVTTVFAYQFLLTLAADLVVTVAGVVKTLNVDYTVSGLGSESGGDVTFTVAPAAAASIILQRVISLERATDYQNFGDFKADTVNADFDRLWMALQGTKEEVDRSIRVAADSPAVDLELPAPVALTYLRWNALASKLEAVLLADISLISLTAYAQTLLDAVDAAAARVVLGISTVGSSIITAANAAAARLAMGAAASGANSDITSLGNNTSTLYTTGGTSTAYTLTPSPAITAYAAGQSFYVTFSATNGASPTLAISGVATPPNLVRQLAGGTYANVEAGAIVANQSYRVTLRSATQAIVENLQAKASTVQIITASGTYTPPVGLKFAIVKLQAPGGGGGGAVASASNLAVGSGGGGGGYAERLVTAAQIGASQTVTMGTVGAAGDAAGSSGGTGGTTSFGSLLSATGGSGGGSISGGSVPSRGSNPGSGGIGSLGDINIRGGSGEFASRFSGTNGSSGNGGSSYLGGGAVGVTEGGSGNAGGNYGGGGSGGNSDSATGRAGGVGGIGVIYVHEFY